MAGSDDKQIEERIYGVAVQRAAFKADPARVMRMVDEHGAVTIVDEDGTPRTVICASQAPECEGCDERDGRITAAEARLAAAEARARSLVAALDVGAIVDAEPRRGLREAGESVKAAVLAALGGKP